MFAARRHTLIRDAYVRLYIVLTDDTYTEPTVLWRLHREDGTARAIIVPHTIQTTLLVWINEETNVAEAFEDWSGAMECASRVHARLVKDGWSDVS